MTADLEFRQVRALEDICDHLRRIEETLIVISQVLGDINDRQEVN